MKTLFFFLALTPALAFADTRIECSTPGVIDAGYGVTLTQKAGSVYHYVYAQDTYGGSKTLAEKDMVLEAQNAHTPQCQINVSRANDDAHTVRFAIARKGDKWKVIAPPSGADVPDLQCDYFSPHLLEKLCGDMSRKTPPAPKKDEDFPVAGDDKVRCHTPNMADAGDAVSLDLVEGRTYHYVFSQDSFAGPVTKFDGEVTLQAEDSHSPRCQLHVINPKTHQIRFTIQRSGKTWKTVPGTLGATPEMDCSVSPATIQNLCGSLGTKPASGDSDEDAEDGSVIAN